MGETKWTSEQLDAITENGRNLLVAAAAGAGKTAVLVERIIRKITNLENPIDIDRLLIVTFTNASATEMRERIGDAIAKALEENPSSKQLQRQMTLLNKASITTIHSFCLEVIRNNFHTIDLDPAFKIADETEGTLMKLEIIEELFEDKYEENNQSFLDLVESYSGNKDDRRLQENVLNIFAFIQSAPWPSKWLDEMVEKFNISKEEDFSNTEWAKMLMDIIIIELDGMRAMLKKGLDIAQNTEGLAGYAETLKDDFIILDILKNASKIGWNELVSTFVEINFSTLKRCSKDADKEVQEQVKDIRDQVKSSVKSYKTKLFSRTTEELSEDFKYLYPIFMELSNIVKEFSNRFSNAKKEKSLLDFNDLEHICLKILVDSDDEGNLTPSSVAFELQNKYEEIMIDEYQDSNNVQEVLMKTISRQDSDKPNLFMVGDVKQSIYRFRQAKPELFMQKYDTYPSETGFKSKKILLYKNFRSRSEVIDAVNFIFEQIMTKNVGELDYEEKERLNYGAYFGENTENIVNPVELHLLDMCEENYSEMDNDSDEEEEKTEDEESLDSIRAEAIMVVKRIRGLFADGSIKGFSVFDKKKNIYRAIEYKDIIILLRSTKNWSDIFVEELTDSGIPVYSDTGTGFFRTIEIQIIMSLLQIIDNPYQDIPIIAVLRSPIFGFTEDELLSIKLESKNVNYYSSILKYLENNENTIAIKLQSFIEKLNIWREKARFMSTDDLIWYLYNDTSFYSYAAAMPGGVQRVANLRMLLERAKSYERTSYKGLFNFINFINKLKSSSGDMGSAKIIGENENVVRIMSIHKSKGLEFPVVFVSGCGKGFNFQDMNKSILLHQELGFGPELVDFKKRVTYPTLPKQALRFKLKIESLSEEMRILYVALTRAREKLILTGTVKNLQKKYKNWSYSLDEKEQKLSVFNILKAKSYLDFIVPALLRHKACEALRNLGKTEALDNVNVNFIPTASIWETNIVNVKELSINDKLEALKLDKKINMTDFDVTKIYSDYRAEIFRRLDFEYKYGFMTNISAKLTVTELKRHFNIIDDGENTENLIFKQTLIKKPLFLEGEKTLSSSEKGTLLHFVMQHIDITKVVTLDEVKNQIKSMQDRMLITPEQSIYINPVSVFKFFSSSIGKRLINATKVKREVPFNMEINVEELHKGVNLEKSDDKILIQGVIDCYFEEDNELVLIDYKTDFVPDGGNQLIVDRYRFQLEYYKRALETITGKNVKETYIYLFYNGNEVKI